MTTGSTGTPGGVQAPVTAQQVSEVGTLNDQIQNISLEIARLIATSKDVREQLKSVKDQLRSTNAARPVKTEGQSDEAFNAQMGDYQGKVADLQSTINDLNDTLEQLYKDVEEAQHKIQNLEGQKGGAAARDADRMRRELEAEQEKLESTAAKLEEPEDGDASSSQLSRKLTLKKVERQIPVAVEGNSELRDAIKAFALLLAHPQQSVTQQNKYTGSGVQNAGRVLPLSEPSES
jgi:chromosome segregation ATPase|tara:strand:- start:346 stop:1047 length:702 start_codon:yes stop_codon:yes gene_type:complete